MIFQAEVKLQYIGQVEISAVDESAARAVYGNLQGAIFGEIQNFPNVNLNSILLDGTIEPLVEEIAGPAFRINVTSFKVVVGIGIESVDEHAARVSLGTLETQLLDELGNWPTVELEEQSITAEILNTT